MNDFSQKKQIITISAVIALLLLIGFFAYRLFQSPPKEESSTGSQGVISRLFGIRLPSPSKTPPPLEGEQPPPPGGGSPQPTAPGSVTEQKLLQLTTFPVIAPSLNREENKILFYKKEGGNLLSTDFHGAHQEKVSKITVVGLDDAVWAKTRDRAALFYLDQETMKSFVQIGTSSVTVLPQDITSLSWSPDGKLIAYTVLKDNQLDLTIIESSGKNAKTVFRTPLRDSRIQWASVDTISFLTAPSGLAEGFLFAFSRAKGSFKKLLGPYFGLTTLWSPDSAQALISTTKRGGKELKLSLYTAVSGKLTDLPLHTLPEKCVWATLKEIYCAEPRNKAANIVWPDDYYRGEILTSDQIIRFDLERNESETIFNEGVFDITNPILTKTADYLFFIDGTGGMLWRLKLR